MELTLKAKDDQAANEDGEQATTTLSLVSSPTDFRSPPDDSGISDRKKLMNVNGGLKVCENASEASLALGSKEQVASGKTTSNCYTLGLHESRRSQIAFSITSQGPTIHNENDGEVSPSHTHSEIPRSGDVRCRSLEEPLAVSLTSIHSAEGEVADRWSFPCVNGPPYKPANIANVPLFNSGNIDSMFRQTSRPDEGVPPAEDYSQGAPMGGSFSFGWGESLSAQERLSTGSFKSGEPGNTNTPHYSSVSPGLRPTGPNKKQFNPEHSLALPLESASDGFPMHSQQPLVTDRGLENDYSKARSYSTEVDSEYRFQPFVPSHVSCNLSSVGSNYGEPRILGSILPESPIVPSRQPVSSFSAPEISTAFANVQPGRNNPVGIRPPLYNPGFEPFPQTEVANSEQKRFGGSPFERHPLFPGPVPLINPYISGSPYSKVGGDGIENTGPLGPMSWNSTNGSLPGFKGQSGQNSEMSSARRRNATRESTATLKAWLQEHIKNPYPTKGEKIMLAIITKMTLTQVSTWFANARRRLKKENKMTWTPKHRGEEMTGEDEDGELLESDDDCNPNDGDHPTHLESSKSDNSLSSEKLNIPEDDRLASEVHMRSDCYTTQDHRPNSKADSESKQRVADLDGCIKSSHASVNSSVALETESDVFDPRSPSRYLHRKRCKLVLPFDANDPSLEDQSSFTSPWSSVSPKIQCYKKPDDDDTFNRTNFPPLRMLGPSYRETNTPKDRVVSVPQGTTDCTQKPPSLRPDEFPPLFQNGWIKGPPLNSEDQTINPFVDRNCTSVYPPTMPLTAVHHHQQNLNRFQFLQNFESWRMGLSETSNPLLMNNGPPIGNLKTGCNEFSAPSSSPLYQRLPTTANLFSPVSLLQSEADRNYPYFSNLFHQRNFTLPSTPPDGLFFGKLPEAQTLDSLSYKRPGGGCVKDTCTNPIGVSNPDEWSEQATVNFEDRAGEFSSDMNGTHSPVHSSNSSSNAAAPFNTSPKLHLFHDLSTDDSTGWSDGQFFGTGPTMLCGQFTRDPCYTSGNPIPQLHNSEAHFPLPS
ncbi:unnamed protein product [Calicophoron daubneyi]|uniref:Homeobox domain-containing protein n=1 Tax=Calicophoron daubneyi TaxID=300641 RepID=A0AAV2SZS6_CALDB